MDDTDSTADFDAADLADAILAPPPPATPRVAAPVWTEAQRAAAALAVILIVLLMIGLAAMAGDGRSEQPCQPEPYPAIHDDGRGLFDDAEQRFTRQPCR